LLRARRLQLFRGGREAGIPSASRREAATWHTTRLCYRTETKPEFHAMRKHIMKHKILVVTFLSAAAFTVGCNQEQTASEQLDKVQTETKQAAQDMKDYTFAQKAEFVEKMQGQLAALNRDLDQLVAKVESSSDAVKAEAKPKLQALRDQTGQLNKQLDEVRNATESTWDSVKGGFKKAYESSKDGFNQARQWVSDKIAP
jgi:cytochrome c556